MSPVKKKMPWNRDDSKDLVVVSEFNLLRQEKGCGKFTFLTSNPLLLVVGADMAVR